MHCVYNQLVIYLVGFLENLQLCFFCCELLHLFSKFIKPLICQIFEIHISSYMGIANEYHKLTSFRWELSLSGCTEVQVSILAGKTGKGGHLRTCYLCDWKAWPVWRLLWHNSPGGRSHRETRKERCRLYLDDHGFRQSTRVLLQSVRGRDTDSVSQCVEGPVPRPGGTGTGLCPHFSLGLWSVRQYVLFLRQRGKFQWGLWGHQ